jgi:transposase
MIRIEFPPEDVLKIKRLRHEHSHQRVRLRMEVLWLKSQGLAHQDICWLSGVSANTLRAYLRKYQSGGIQALMELNFRTPQSALEPHRLKIKSYFRDHPPATINEAAAKIQELTEIKRSPSAVGNFLHSLGLAPRRVGTIPSKADPEEQERFRINELEPRLEEARQGQRAIFLSMPLISCWAPFSACFGRAPVCS